jgi:membrane associated rhomboid family serine protease
MALLEQIHRKLKEIVLVYAVIFIPIWSIFLLNNLILQGSLNGIGGIHPRDFSLGGLVGIFTSWMFHLSYSGGVSPLLAHVLGNSEALFGLLWIVALFESRPIVILAALIVASGLATWLLGSADAVHIGASGLIFAIFGYVTSSIFLARRWLYLLPVIAFGSGYVYSIKAGLVPQAGISLAAHFGGLVGGVLVAYLLGRFDSRTPPSA